jgi:undecaprenyl pyrophosphate phosphatase UppP
METIEGGFTGVDATSALVGMLVSFVVGYLTIDFLLRIAHRIRFDLFCILLGGIAALVSSATFFIKVV